MRKTVTALVLGGLGLMATHVRGGNLAPATEELLQSASYIYVATQRKNGELGSFSPIWFTYDQGKIFFTTAPESWKAKRLGKSGPVTIRVGTEDGPVVTGIAQQVTDPAYVDRMGKAYNDKYWIAWMGFFRPRSERVSEGKTIAYVVEPEEPS
jgi:PPOX class probable F420-dependent enzyme